MRPALATAFGIGVFITASCDLFGDSESDSTPATKTTPTKADATTPKVRPSIEIAAHMREHATWADGLREAIAAGDLEAAREHGVAFADHGADPALAEVGAAPLADMRKAATAVANATSIEQAAEYLGQAASACGSCHQMLEVVPRFRVVPRPMDTGDTPSRMALHQWTNDRLWEGVIGPIDPSWQQAMETLRGANLCDLPRSKALPTATTVPDPQLRTRLDKHVAAAPTATTAAARGQWYGTFLTTCAQCHQNGCTPAAP